LPELVYSLMTPLETATCPPALVKSEALPAGVMRITILSPCRRGQKIRLSYAGFEYSRTLDDIGFLTTTLDSIAGDAVPVTVLFEDGSRNTLTVTAQESCDTIGGALAGPVNMDLHAFEYGAAIGKPGMSGPALPRR
jgi:hypothetical protein